MQNYDLFSLKSCQIYFLPGLNMYWIDKKLKMKKKSEKLVCMTEGSVT